MECLSPRNGVPCGTCPRCRLNRQRDWTFRLTYERDSSDFVFWLTLTFDDQHLEQVLSSEMAAREPSRHFLESIRKHFGKRLGIKHYLVTEYGDLTDRFHHHCLLFCRAPAGSDHFIKLNLRQELFDFIGANDWDRLTNTCWPYGGVRSEPLHSGVFPYITNYVNKPELLNKEHKIRPFTRISQGIGLDYLDRIDKTQFKNMDLSVYFEGSKKVLPRYYREKLFPRSKQTLQKAYIRNEDDLINAIQYNRYHHDHVEAWKVASKKHINKERARSDFERDHSISYDDYLLHTAANEFRKYQERLKKRQNL